MRTDISVIGIEIGIVESNGGRKGVKKGSMPKIDKLVDSKRVSKKNRQYNYIIIYNEKSY